MNINFNPSSNLAKAYVHMTLQHLLLRLWHRLIFYIVLTITTTMIIFSTNDFCFCCLGAQYKEH